MLQFIVEKKKIYIYYLSLSKYVTSTEDSTNLPPVNNIRADILQITLISLYVCIEQVCNNNKNIYKQHEQYFIERFNFSEK